MFKVTITCLNWNNLFTDGVDYTTEVFPAERDWMLLGTNKIHLRPKSFKADDRLCFIHGEQKQLNRARLSVA